MESISLDLGPRVVCIGKRALGVCNEVAITVDVFTPEYLTELQNTPAISLRKLNPWEERALEEARG